LDPVWYLGQPRNSNRLDNVKKGLISMNLCATNNQIADIFTKALSREQFEKNMLKLGLIKIT